MRTFSAKIYVTKEFWVGWISFLIGLPPKGWVACKFYFSFAYQWSEDTNPAWREVWVCSRCALKLKHCNCLIKIMGPFNPSEWFELKCSTTILFFDGSILEFLWKVTEIKSVPRSRKFAIWRISKLGRMIWLAKVCLRWVTAETFLIISASRRINPWLIVCC